MAFVKDFIDFLVWLIEVPVYFGGFAFCIRDAIIWGSLAGVVLLVFSTFKGE